MNRTTGERRALSSLLSELYGYIYCMLLSNAMTSLPLYGGALYLCGRAVLVFGTIYRRKNRDYLAPYARRWIIVLSAVLLALLYAMIGLFPAGLENANLWILFSAAFLCVAEDGTQGWIAGLNGEGRRTNWKSLLAAMIMQLFWACVMTAVLLFSMGVREGGTMAAAFVLRTLVPLISMVRRNGSREDKTEENGNASETEMQDIRSVHLYHAYEWISMLIAMAVEMTLAVVYALLAIGTEHILPAVATGVACTLLFAAGGAWSLRRTENRRNPRDPTWLLCAGLILWIVGIWLCSRMLLTSGVEYTKIYICMGICSAGGILCMTGLDRIDALMPDIARAIGLGLPPEYDRIRTANWEFSRLLGDVLALIGLTVFCFANGKNLPRDAHEIAARFQPILMTPALLVSVGALLSVFRFPLGSRYIAKLQHFLQIKDTGEDNQILQNRLKQVVTGNYRQPFLAGFLIRILRLVYPHKLRNGERIVTDASNPVVFVCNHGEFYGPIVCILYIPVPVRAWTISMMMSDRREIADYIYENTFSRIEWLPVWGRKALARLMGWLSFKVMGQVESIPVYRDQPMKLRETIRQSVEALETGDNVLIFPENPETRYQLKGIGRISSGFLMLGPAYWKKTGKRLQIIPMYASKASKTITFGNKITYRPEASYSEEQERITGEVLRQIREMAAEADGGEE